MGLVPHDAFKVAEEEYEKYRYRWRIARIIFGVLYLASLSTFTIFSVLNRLERLEASLILGGLIASFVALYMAKRFLRIARDAFPSIEYRTLYCLKPGVEQLGAFASHQGKESYKKSCLSHLKEAARVIDMWSAGNLRFTQRNVREKLQRFKKAFRERLIPAVQAADRDKAGRLHNFLFNIQNNLLYMDEGNLDSWCNFLDPFPAASPGVGRLRELLLIKAHYHLLYVGTALTAAYAYFLFLRNNIGADVNAATTGFNTVVTVFLSPYAVYLVGTYLLRQKGKPSSGTPAEG